MELLCMEVYTVLGFCVWLHTLMRVTRLVFLQSESAGVTSVPLRQLSLVLGFCVWLHTWMRVTRLGYLQSESAGVTSVPLRQLSSSSGSTEKSTGGGRGAKGGVLVMCK